MNLWIIAAIVVGLLLVAGIAMATFTTADKVAESGCKSCNGKCTAENNCGLATCGAVNGGKCGCGG